MKSRCYNQKMTQFKDYGGRGIQVCDKWLHSFEAFYRDMGPRPSPSHSVDRRKNDGDYEPTNCRWATRAVQATNTSRNRRITFNGRTQCVARWATDIGIHQSTLFERLEKGWPLHLVLAREVVAVLMLPTDSRIAPTDICVHPRNVRTDRFIRVRS